MTNVQFERIDFDKLTKIDKRQYNHLSVSAALANYGFFSQGLLDNNEPVDFIASHYSGTSQLSVLLKSRLTLASHLEHQNLLIAFYERGYWYVYPHDDVLAFACQTSTITHTTSWQQKGIYTFPQLTDKYRQRLKPWRL
ncbi:MAG: hypothetical protein B0D91_11845 [Oceanospirillales bacterium LUC14_002_19_P2]|nr:MAG: hypothetical protein B0D91_11845 [Oceanospirillales bacterium LUC14_002_19_P2]